MIHFNKISVLLIALFLFSLSACSNSQTVSKIPEKDVDSLLAVYSDVLVERFGAELDIMSGPYKTDENAGYWLVTNFKTVEEVKNHMLKYITASFLDSKLIEEDFIEDDGNLLMVRGSRGYGYYGIDPELWEYLDDTSVKVQFTILDVPVEGTYCTLTFKNENGSWKICGFELPEGY